MNIVPYSNKNDDYLKEDDFTVYPNPDIKILGKLKQNKTRTQLWNNLPTELGYKKIKVIGSEVTVTVDRPLGSYHPEHKDMYYPINYGYIEGIMAPDGEEQDAYILGIDEAVDIFTGKIIAIVHRNDDVEEKWVVAPESMIFSKEEIRKQIDFQEQYFDSEIVM